MKQNYDDILQFWFQTLDPMQWWNQSQELDDIIRKKFQQAHETANLGELYHWRSEPLGRLAEIIILDQFSRNMYRNTPKAFASDLTALVLAQEAIRSGCDQKLSPIERSFLYMPFMHSESSRIHSDAVELFKKNGIDEWRKIYALPTR